MKTRSEFLLEALQQVGDNIKDFDERMDAALHNLEQSNYEHAAEMRRAFEGHGDSIEHAAEMHGQSIEHAASDIAHAIDHMGDKFVFIGILSALATVVVSRMEANAKVHRSNQQFCQMVDSILMLQRTHGPMKYKFILKRSFAEGTKKGERRTILNGLITYGIVERKNFENKELFFIDEDGENFGLFCDAVNELNGFPKLSYSGNVIEHEP